MILPYRLAGLYISCIVSVNFPNMNMTWNMFLPGYTITSLSWNHRKMSEIEGLPKTYAVTKGGVTGGNLVLPGF